MAQRKVTAIPATINKFTADPVNIRKKRRTAGYARVSTDHEDQVTSYAAQVDYYTNYIQGREDWEFAGIYTDEGISATNTKKRDGFNRMVADALAGKIDLIITKSVSRFARNTVDSLTTIRKLKEHNVECYFEKENIWTFDSKGELLLTIMSSLAQEESRSISENVTWGHRKRFADGKVSFAYSRVLGLEKEPDGNIVVNQEQAKIVKLIFRRFLEGMTPHSIAVELTEMGIKSPGARISGTEQQSVGCFPMRSTKAMPCFKKNSRWITCRKRPKRMRAKFPSIMWRATTKPSSSRAFMIWCRWNSPNAPRKAKQGTAESASSPTR